MVMGPDTLPFASALRFSPKHCLRCPAAAEAVGGLQLFICSFVATRIQIGNSNTPLLISKFKLHLCIAPGIQRRIKPMCFCSYFARAWMAHKSHNLTEDLGLFNPSPQFLSTRFPGMSAKGCIQNSLLPILFLTLQEPLACGLKE